MNSNYTEQNPRSTFVFCSQKSAHSKSLPSSLHRDLPLLEGLVGTAWEPSKPEEKKLFLAPYLNVVSFTNPGRCRPFTQISLCGVSLFAFICAAACVLCM
jgi:hypothetical protein